MDEEEFKAMVSRRRKKRLAARIELLKPIYTTHFDEGSGELDVFDSFTFGGASGLILDGPVQGQVGQQPGAIALEQFSNRVKLGFWSVMPFEVSRALPFQLKSIDIVSGNYNNYTIDLQAFMNGVMVASHTFVTGPDNPLTVSPTFPLITMFKLVRNTGNVETRHPAAVGTIIIQGGRPRPPVYTESIFMTNIKYKL